METHDSEDVDMLQEGSGGAASSSSSSNNCVRSAEEDLDTAPLHTLQKIISSFNMECSGISPPILRLDANDPYRKKAHCILDWAMSLLNITEEDEVFDQADAVRCIMLRMNKTNKLWKHYKRFIPELASIPERDDISESKALEHAWHYWNALGNIHTILTNVHKISRCMHVLTCTLSKEMSEEKKQGNFTTKVITDSDVVDMKKVDVVRSFQMKEFVRAWNQSRSRMTDQNTTTNEESQENADKKRGGASFDKHLNVVQHCLDIALASEYKRLGSIVYEERKVFYNGVWYGTRAYTPAKWPGGDSRRDKSTLQEFVTHACAKERYPDMWKLTTDSVTFNKVISYLERAIDSEFPTLRQQRNLFSFKNGIYDTKGGYTGAFHSYDIASKVLHPSDTAAKYFDQEVQPEWFEAAQKKMGGWFDIPTPLFQSILDYQNYGEVRPADIEEQPPQDFEDVKRAGAMVDMKRTLWDFLETLENACLDSGRARTPSEKAAPILSMLGHCETLQKNLTSITSLLKKTPLPGKAASSGKEGEEEPCQDSKTRPGVEPGNELPEGVQRWIYIFLGRLLHDLNTFDSWQIMPFLKGKAGTGKSIIGLVAKSFFEAEQVGILSSNIETKFGLGALADHFIILCLEVKKNFQLNQAEFQSIVSGEMIQLAVKNKAAFSKKWSSPGLLCGNEWASYQDAQGSIARRLAIVNFKFSISDKDSNPNLLNEILENELAALIIKCNMAYREQAEIKKGEDIWKILPQYFKQQRRLLQVETDPLWATIYDENIFERIPTGYVSWADFQKEYVQKWKQIRGTQFPEYLTEDKYGPALKDAGLEKVWAKRVDPAQGGEAKVTHWVLGLRLLRDVFDEEGAAARASAVSAA